MKAVIFDCFGVLTTDLWREFVATLPEAQKEPARELNRAYDSGHISRDAFLAEIKQLTDRLPQEVEAMTSGQAVKNVELMDFIRQLHTEYKTAVLSNIASSWITDEFLTAEEQEYFDEFVFSRDVGLIKPDPRIYELTAERLGVEPKDCVMVDDIERNCHAAEALGMRSVAYKDFAGFKAEIGEILKKS